MSTVISKKTFTNSFTIRMCLQNDKMPILFSSTLTDRRRGLYEVCYDHVI